MQWKLGDRFFGARVECSVVPWHEELTGGGLGDAEAIS